MLAHHLSFLSILNFEDREGFMSRRMISLTLFFLIITIESRAATVIVMDEGINTGKSWRAKNVTDPIQICRSLLTDLVTSITDPEEDFFFDSISLCDDAQSQIRLDKIGASQFESKRDYGSGPFATEINVFAEDVSGELRGDHGNAVSNALFDFHKTIKQRPILMMG